MMRDAWFRSLPNLRQDSVGEEAGQQIPPPLHMWKHCDVTFVHAKADAAIAWPNHPAIGF